MSIKYIRRKYSQEIRVFSKNVRALKERVLKLCVQSADKTCAECIKPFLLLFKLCGLFANKVTVGQVKRCSWSTYGICVFWIGLFVTCIYYLFLYLVKLKRIYLEITVHFAKHFLGCISLSADVITAYSSQNHFSKFFDRLDGYDYKVAQIKNKRRDNLWIPWIVALLLIFVSLLLVSVMRLTELVGDIFLSLLLDLCMMIIQMHSFLEKFLLLYLVLVRFRHLNKNIAPNVSWDEERREPNTIEISDVQIMYLMLYDAHKAFNDIYRYPLFLSFSFLMMCVVANLSIFRKGSASTACSLVCPPMMLILIICIICHCTTKEANNITCVLNKSMTMLVHSGKTTTKISALTYFLHNCVSFDAAGFFTIDLPLFHSIVASLATYFIILV
ncbi:uncharacterized protein LOC143905759 [Temnothorax americanus]|uniref:uncharacterized protein LOC143905759 n=1 Tax=Temnothorax americanus TaxID=1964332 RepID=UPI00406842EA